MTRNKCTILRRSRAIHRALASKSIDFIMAYCEVCFLAACVASAPGKGR